MRHRATLSNCSCPFYAIRVLSVVGNGPSTKPVPGYVFPNGPVPRAGVKLSCPPRSAVAGRVKGSNELCYKCCQNGVNSPRFRRSKSLRTNNTSSTKRGKLTPFGLRDRQNCAKPAPRGLPVITVTRVLDGAAAGRLGWAVGSHSGMGSWRTRGKMEEGVTEEGGVQAEPC
jgi:hypothetical protein